MKINFEQESYSFIKYAFVLLRRYKKNPYLTDSERILYLQHPFYLKINDKGQLSIWSTDCKQPRAHGWNKKAHTQLTYVGILLGKYLELLQSEGY